MGASNSHTNSQFMDANELIKCRISLGMSRIELASKLRLPKWGHQTIGDWETGATPIPGVVTLAIEYLLFLDACGFSLPDGSQQSRQKPSTGETRDIFESG
jgi:transcriptional regulator with XRE-family HTH domain